MICILIVAVLFFTFRVLQEKGNCRLTNIAEVVSFDNNKAESCKSALIKTMTLGKSGLTALKTL